MDIKGGDDDEEARIILYKQRDEDNDNQLWYEDRNGFIRSKMSDFVFDTFGGYNILNFTLLLEGQGIIYSIHFGIKMICDFILTE